MKEMICIVCPKGCRLKVDEDNGFAVTGNGCPRGAVYGKSELTDPQRTVTGTVKIKGALHRKCPVKTDKTVPKDKMGAVVRALNDITLRSPVRVGDVVISHVAGCEANIVCTKSM